MAITVNDIRNKQFEILARGYNCDEVDDFLDALAEQTEKLVRENIALNNELKAAQEAAARQPENAQASVEAEPVPSFNEPSYFKNLETTLRETLINAQRIADDTIADARKKADRIVAEAEDQAASMQEESAAKLAQVKADYEALKTASEEYRRNFNELIEGQARLLKDNPMFA